MPGFPLPGFFEDGRRQGADLVSQELVMLDAVLLAEAKDHANWSCLAGMVDDLPAGAIRDAFQTAVDEVEVQENEHLQ
jgi:hypothetical protein